MLLPGQSSAMNRERLTSKLTTTHIYKQVDDDVVARKCIVHPTEQWKTTS